MKSLIKLNSPVYFESSASVVGGKEHSGPLGDRFDFWDGDAAFGMKTWERAEAEMQRIAFNLALNKIYARDRDVGAVFAGDLLNQCTASAYGLLPYDVPYFGLYGACSTAVEALILASLLIEGDHFTRIAASASSHNCTAERQFRTPIEYGGQRPQSAQWTVTGAAAFILSGRQPHGSAAKITHLMPGRSLDLGISDTSDMGAAMAPAAADTLTRYFRESDTTPDDCAKIVTGDLGSRGYDIMVDLMEKSGYDVRKKYTDCGMMIYDLTTDDVHSGGSGCGCSAVVLASHFLREIERGALGSVLFLGTGAMMSPCSIQQGENIPAIAHLIRIGR